MLPYERVAKCGQRSLGQIVTLHSHEGHAHFGGVETCGSVWMCPVCAAKITEARREELDLLLKVHREAGGHAFMATLTIPHHRFQSCRDLKQATTAAWRQVKSGKAWIKARAKYGWLGDVRALEVTHGKNGWHPHLHVLILFRPETPKTAMYGMGGFIFNAWARAIERMDMGRCSKNAFTYEPVTAEGGAADYVGKWGAALELTKAHTKKAKEGSGSRTPWQILGDVSGSSSPTDICLFQEYARAFKGARQLTWSRGLRDMYLAKPEASDDDLAEEIQAPETHAASMTKDLFKVVVAKGLTAHVLAAHEVGGLKAVKHCLTQSAVPWHEVEIPSLEHGRFVPLLCLGPPGKSGIKPDNPGSGLPKKSSETILPLAHAGKRPALRAANTQSQGILKRKRQWQIKQKK